MSDESKPEPRRYEVTWKSGHVEYVEASQVAWPNPLGMLGGDRPSKVTFHRYVGDRWTLVLQALDDDIRTIRDVTADERIEPTA